jgi:hypothetical protein
MFPHYDGWARRPEDGYAEPGDILVYDSINPSDVEAWLDNLRKGPIRDDYGAAIPVSRSAFIGRFTGRLKCSAFRSRDGYVYSVWYRTSGKVGKGAARRYPMNKVYSRPLPLP